jgi:hypothetical protein
VASPFFPYSTHLYGAAAHVHHQAGRNFQVQVTRQDNVVWIFHCIQASLHASRTRKGRRECDKRVVRNVKVFQRSLDVKVCTAVVHKNEIEAIVLRGLVDSLQVFQQVQYPCALVPNGDDDVHHRVRIVLKFDVLAEGRLPVNDVTSNVLFLALSWKKEQR